MYRGSEGAEGHDEMGGDDLNDLMQVEALADQLSPNWRIEPDKILGRRSAVKWAESINVPLLIMHGGNDQSMPATQSLALVDRLQENG